MDKCHECKLSMVGSMGAGVIFQWELPGEELYDHNLAIFMFTHTFIKNSIRLKFLKI